MPSMRNVIAEVFWNIPNVIRQTADATRVDLTSGLGFFNCDRSPGSRRLPSRNTNETMATIASRAHGAVARSGELCSGFQQ